MESIPKWDPTVAYCVGLIAADGCLSGDGRHIEFSSKDLELVEHIQRCFGPHNRIGTKSRGCGPQRYPRIQLGNVALYRWLCSLGMTPRKSLTLGELRIPDPLFGDFLRGCLDGDGSVHSYWDPVYPNSKRLYLKFYSASKTFTDWLQLSIWQLWSLKGYQHFSHRAIHLRYAKAASRVLLTQMYYRHDVPCLQRKRSMISEFLNSNFSAEVAELADA
jgi:hypothetical protein